MRAGVKKLAAPMISTIGRSVVLAVAAALTELGNGDGQSVVDFLVKHSDLGDDFGAATGVPLTERVDEVCMLLEAVYSTVDSFRPAEMLRVRASRPADWREARARFRRVLQMFQLARASSPSGGTAGAGTPSSALTTPAPLKPPPEAYVAPAVNSIR